MSNHVMSLIWRTPIPTQAAKLVALKYADHADDDGGSIFPSIDHVTRQTGLGKTAVYDSIAALEHATLLLQVGTRNSGPTYNRIERAFNMALLEELAWKSKKLPSSQKPVPVPPSKVLVAVERARPNSKKKPPDTYVVFEVLDAISAVNSGCRNGEESGSRTGNVRQAETGIPAAGHYNKPSVGTLNKPSPPQPPTAARRGGRERGVDWEKIFDELRQAGKPDHLIKHLLRPLCEGLTIEHTTPRGLLSEICEIPGLADDPYRVLHAIKHELLFGPDNRNKVVSVKNVADTRKKIRVPMITIVPEMLEQWEAWSKHFVDMDRDKYVKWARQNDGFKVLTEYPPGHPKFTRETPAAFANREAAE